MPTLKLFFKLFSHTGLMTQDDLRNAMNGKLCNGSGVALYIRIAHFVRLTISISTRRFFCRPSSVLLDAIGIVSP